VNEIDRLLEEIFRKSPVKGGGDEEGRRLLRGYLGQLSELASMTAEVEALTRGMLRDRGVNLADLPMTEEAHDDYLFRCIHAATTDVQSVKVAILALWNQKRGGV